MPLLDSEESERDGVDVVRLNAYETVCPVRNK